VNARGRVDIVLGNGRELLRSSSNSGSELTFGGDAGTPVPFPALAPCVENLLSSICKSRGRCFHEFILFTLLWSQRSFSAAKKKMLKVLLNAENIYRSAIN